MAKTYSQDLRDRVLAAHDRGMGTPEIARTFNVSSAWARRVIQVRRETGRTTPLPRGGATVIKIDVQQLAALVEQQPDATLRELRDRLGVQCTESGVFLALKRLGLSFKKRQSMPQNRTGRTLLSGVKHGRPTSRSMMSDG